MEDVEADAEGVAGSQEWGPLEKGYWDRARPLRRKKEKFSFEMTCFGEQYF